MRDTWDSLIRDFLRDLKGTNRAANTQTIYRRAALGLVTFLEQNGDLPGPRQQTRRHIEAYMAHLIDTRSASTANVVYRALQQLMRWLLDEEEIDRSPMERMPPPIVPEKPVPVLTEAQLRALLASAKSASFVDRRDPAIIRLLLDTGGRLSEVAGLTVADLEFESDVAHVIGKGRRPRALPFGQQTGLALGRYLRVRARQPQADRTELWLAEKTRGALSFGGIGQMLRRRGAAVGIPGLHAHQFRHTAAHEWLAGDEVYGADPGLRAALEGRRVGYVLAMAGNRRLPTPGRAAPRRHPGRRPGRPRLARAARPGSTRRRRGRYRVLVAADPPLAAHRQAGLLLLLQPHPGAADPAGHRRRAAVDGGGVLPRRQGPGRPR
jgi:integrase/recombinase XerC